MSPRHTTGATSTGNLRNRVTGMTAAALAAAGIVAGAVTVSPDAPSAQAAPNNVVVFGDSLTANPDVYNYLAGKGAPLPDSILSGAECGTDNRFSDAVGRGAGNGNVANYSCAGASYRTGGMHISQEVEMAKQKNDLNGQTSQVVILAGTNDTYPYVLNDRMPVPEIENNLRISVRDTVRQVRATAPKARIKVVGMPQITNANGDICPINVVPGAPMPFPLVQIGELETALENAVRNGTNDAGVGANFVSLKGISQGHEMCSNDRWIVGLVDTTSGRRNLPVHMTDAGLAAVGEFAGRA